MLKSETKMSGVMAGFLDLAASVVVHAVSL